MVILIFFQRRSAVKPVLVGLKNLCSLLKMISEHLTWDAVTLFYIIALISVNSAMTWFKAAEADFFKHVFVVIIPGHPLVSVLYFLTFSAMVYLSHAGC